MYNPTDSHNSSVGLPGLGTSSLATPLLINQHSRTGIWCFSWPERHDEDSAPSSKKI